VFSLVGVLIALRCCYLQVENMDYYYCGEEVVNDPHANCKPHSNFKQYLKAEESLVEDNYNLMEEHNLFEELEVNGD